VLREPPQSAVVEVITYFELNPPTAEKVLSVHFKKKTARENFRGRPFDIE
jgi:hypothetical protein